MPYFDGLNQQNDNSSRNLLSFGRPNLAKQRFRPNTCLVQTAYISKIAIQAELLPYLDGLSLQNSDLGRTFALSRRPKSTKQQFRPNFCLVQTAYISKIAIQAESAISRFGLNVFTSTTTCIGHYQYQCPLFRAIQASGGYMYATCTLLRL